MGSSAERPTPEIPLLEALGQKPQVPEDIRALVDRVDRVAQVDKVDIYFVNLYIVNNETL